MFISLRILLIAKDSKEAQIIINFLREKGHIVLPLADTYDKGLTAIKESLPELVIISKELDDNGKSWFDISVFIDLHYDISYFYIACTCNHEELEKMKETHSKGCKICTTPKDLDQLLRDIEFMKIKTGQNKLKAMEMILVRVGMNNRNLPDIPEKIRKKHKKTVLMVLSNIAYIEGANPNKHNWLFIWLHDEKTFCYMIRITIKKIIEIFPEFLLIQVNKSVAANPAWVDKRMLPGMVMTEGKTFEFGEQFIENGELMLKHAN